MHVADIDALMRTFDATPGTAYDWTGRFSIAPSTQAPIVREWHDEDVLKREVDYARWGLRPSWAKESGPRPINARLETAATNGMFRTAFAGQRCVVPMKGYYEWEDTPTGKQPHYIHGTGLPTFLQPDLWDGWLAPDKLEDKDEMVARLTESSDTVAGTLTSYRVSRQVN